MELGLMLLNVLLFSVLILKVYSKQGIIRNMILSISCFFSLYVIVSGFYFWMDKFNIIVVLLTCVLIEFVLNIIVVIKRKKATYTIDFNNSFIPLLIVLVAMPIVIPKFGYFGMGQDQGVYQTKAIDLIYGKTERQKDFKEYERLPLDERKLFFDEMENQLLGFGFDRYDISKPTLKAENKLSDFSVIYHGIPTFPAILALWGSNIGIENMAGVQTLFYICSVFLVYFIAENLQLNKLGCILSTSIYAFSPVVIWVSKSSLTEMFLTVIVCMYMYFLTDYKNNKMKWFSALPIVVFSFYHVTIYTMMPLFVIVYFLLYGSTNEKQYLKAIIISCFGFCVGLTMMTYVSPMYTFNNMKKIYVGPVTQENIMLIIFIISVLTSVFAILLKRINIKEILSKLVSNIGEWKLLEKIIRIFLVIAILYMLVYCIMIAYGFIEPNRIDTQGYYYGKGFIKAFQQLTTSAYAYATGVLILPISIILLFKTPRKVLENNETFILSVMFFYCIIIHSMFMRKDIPHYYYYSRYLVPFIPIVTLFAGIILNHLDKNMLHTIVGISLVMFVPFNCVLAIEKDDTRMDWDVLFDIQHSINSEDAIILDSGLMQTVYLPLRAMTKADVYLEDNNLDLQITGLEEQANNVYLIRGLGSDIINEDLYTTVYKSGYYTSQDYNDNHGKLIPFPLGFTEKKESITVYRYETIRTFYDFSEPDTLVSYGFDSLEKDFVWIKDSEAYLQCFLDKKSYIMVIDQGPGIPFDELKRDSIKFSVYMNEREVQKISLNKDTNNKKIEILISEDYINQGKNVLSIKTELWSPLDYGSNDMRKLGFSLKNIEFNELSSKIVYDFGEADDNFQFSGFSGNEMTFRWTNSIESKVHSLLDPDYSYKVEMYLGPKIPFDKISNKTINFSISINSKENIKKEIELNESNYSNVIDFEINKDDLKEDGLNELLIYTDLWSPKEYGSADNRELGISIDKMVFTKLD